MTARSIRCSILSVGGLELGLAVVGGFITGSYVASLLGSPMGRWLHVVMAPTLFVLGVGKLAMVLTGTGQGQPNPGDWATAYLGPGPWGSLLPALPSDPSQAYEGIATLAILTVLTVALMLGAFRRRDGTVFFVGIGLWALARAIVSTTWREPTVVGGLNAGGLIATRDRLGMRRWRWPSWSPAAAGRRDDPDPDTDANADADRRPIPSSLRAAPTGRRRRRRSGRSRGSIPETRRRL